MAFNRFPDADKLGQQYNAGEKPTVRACVNDVPKTKIGKNQNQNWALIDRGSKPPDYASLFFGNRCQTKEVPRDLMFIFRKINIGGVHLIEGFPNATRQRPDHSRVTTAARRQTAPPHNTHNTTSAGMAHANGPTARATVNSSSWWWGQEQRVVLNFGDADTTQKTTGATSAQIDFVCIICTSNSSTAAVASLSLPLSLSVSLFKGTSQRNRHLSICPFIFSQLQRSVCTNGIYSLLPFWQVLFFDL